MAAGYSIGVASDTKAFSEGIANGVVKPLEDADKTLKALADTSDGASQKITAALKAEQNATDKTRAVHVAAGESIAQSYRSQTQVAQNESAKQTEAFELSNREVNSIQKEGLRAGASNIAQTVAQTAQGFDGTAASAASTIGNIGTGIAALGTGPIVGVGLAASVGFGIVSQVIQKSEEDAKALAATVTEDVKAIEQLGSHALDSVSAVNAKLKEFSANTDGSNTDLGHLSDTASAAGVSFAQYADALAGNVDDQQSLYAEVQKQIPLLERQVAGFNSGAHGSSLAAVAARNQLAALQDVSSALVTENKALGESKARVSEYGTAFERTGNQSVVAAAKSAAAWKAAGDDFSDIGNKLQSQQSTNDSVLKSAQDKLTADLQASGGKQTKAVKDARAAEVAASKAANADTLANFIATQDAELAALQGKKQSEIEIYEKFGPAAAKAIIKDVGSNATLLSNIAGAGPDDIAKIKANYAKAGKEAATTYAQEAQKQINVNHWTGPLIPAPVIDVDTALKNAQKQLNAKPLNITLTGSVAGKRVI